MPRSVLISGGGIAGLTAAILLKQQGYEPLVIEREPRPREEGYMMDFFGTGWDVVGRMGLTDELRAIRYPIERMEFVDDGGRAYFGLPIERLRDALSHRYVYLRRQDLERILLKQARAADIAIRFATEIRAIEDGADAVQVTFADGSAQPFSLVVGADGLHSRVRELCFGSEKQFSRFLGAYVAAFNVGHRGYGLGRAIKLHEEIDRSCAFYPLSGDEIDATYVFRSEDRGHVPRGQRLSLLKEIYRGTGYIAERALSDVAPDTPVYFDSMTEVAMPQWHRGRVVLIGDACGCLTLLAGQGSHMAMAGAFVLTRELERAGGDHRVAFPAYQTVLAPHVEKKQRDAAMFSRIFIRSPSSWPWLRRLSIRLIFSRLSMRWLWPNFGTVSVLQGYR